MIRLPLAPPAALHPVPDEPIPFVFTDVTDRSGFSWPVPNGSTGEKLLPETMSGGCAVFDYDDDGDPDVLLVGNIPWEGDELSEASLRLYRNDGSGNFLDVTLEAGLNLPLHGMGAAAADYDGNGSIDLFVTAVGGNLLLKNSAGRFEDVTGEAGVAGDPSAWSTSCGWFDYDRDGDLDLFVANYVEWSPELDRRLDCTLTGSLRGFCRPELFAGSHPWLYRNDGNGRFTEFSDSAGLRVRDRYTGALAGKSLAFALLDLEFDGWLDIVVSNDGTPNFLFQNQRDGTFREIGSSSGLGFDSSGSARRQFGTDAAWMPESGAWGVACGTVTGEPLVFFRSAVRPLQFNDDSLLLGFGPDSRLSQKVSPLFCDFDLDGRLDMLMANGHWEPGIEQLRASQSYAQSPDLFWNTGQPGAEHFVHVSQDRLGPGFSTPLAARGAALADFDGDGDPDILLIANGGPPRLLRNDQQAGHQWLRVRLQGPRAVGARVELTAGAIRQTWLAVPHRGYLSQSELAVTFGLGQANVVERLAVYWPDADVWEESNLPAGTSRVITPGSK